MSAAKNVEYFILEYVPVAVCYQSISIAAVFLDCTDFEAGMCMMSIADDWRAKVRFLDPNADLEMVGALLTEIETRLSSKSDRFDCVRQLEDSFSNVVQISPRRKYRGGATPDVIKAFARQLWQSPNTLHRISP